MVELFTRMSSAVNANRDIWDIELEWILAQGCFTGVRINIGMSAEISADPYAADTSNLEYVLRRIAANGLKCQLGLGGDGPNKDNDEWWGLNEDAETWLSTKRPPLGDSNLIAYYSAQIKSTAIAVMVDIYESYGLNPYHYCYLELGNEPAIGGAGSPPEGDSFYSTFGLTYSDRIGLWDSETELGGTGVPKNGASFLEFFTIELGYMDLAGLRCIAPSFTAKRLWNTTVGSVNGELNSFDRADTSGNKWIDIVRERNELIFSLNCYYNTFDLGTTGVHPEQYCWPTCGPIDYAEIAVFGFDGRALKSGDSQCIMYKVNLIRDKAKSRIGDSPLIVGEAGVHYRFMGMTDDPATEPVAGPLVVRDPNYYVNIDFVGDAELEYLDRLRVNGFTYVIHYSVSDAITNYAATDAWKEIYGIFRLDSSITGIPTLQTQQTYSKAIAWARRYGLPTTGGSAITNPNKGAYWGKQFRRGDDENVP